MRSHQRQGQAVSVGFLLCVFLPFNLKAAEVVGVAKAAGPAQLNGVPFPGEVSVFSGDRLSTGKQTTLVVSSGPQERVHLAGGSSAQITKQDGRLTVSVLKGVVGFESAGRTRIMLEQYGVTIEGKGGEGENGHPIIGQVALVGPGKAEIKVLTGAVELIGAQQTVSLKKGDLGLIVARYLQDPQTGTTESGAAASGQTAAGTVRFSVVGESQSAVAGAGVILTSEQDRTLIYRGRTDQLGEVTIEGVRPGFYRIQVRKAGYTRQELGPVEVIAGEETSLGSVKLDRGEGNEKVPLLILVIGNAGGVITVVALSGREDSGTPISPSSP